MEQLAPDRGRDEVQLNVFDGNVPARALHGSLGYEERDASMAKPLIRD